MSKVFIAAGHYPAAPGAGFEGFFEHDEAAQWVSSIVALDAELFSVVPVGDLKAKARWINARARAGDIAVEVHFNSAMNAAGAHIGSGSVTLYMPGSEEGKSLAGVCQSALASVFPPDRGVVEGWYRGDRERGAYYFLEKTICTAVILEPEFVHHKDIIVARRDACCYALFSALRGRMREDEGPAVRTQI